MKDGHEEALGQVVQVLRQIVQNFERLQKGSAKLVPETRWSDSETSQSSEEKQLHLLVSLIVIGDLQKLSLRN